MLALPAHITIANAADVCQGLVRAALALPEGERVTFDASALVQFDSAALAVLLECHRQLSRAKRGLSVRHLPQKLEQLTQIYGISELLVPVERHASAPSLT